MPKESRAAPLPLSAYPARTNDMVRYGDLDPQGHVNNAVYVTFFETGRVEIFRNPNSGLLVPGANMVMARLEIDYLRELRWPNTLVVGSGIAKIGRTSYTFAQGVFCGEECAAVCRATVVLIDDATRRPRPVPDDMLARLRALAMPEPEPA
jgi:acyl-CoA thioester hydrolase